MSTYEKDAPRGGNPHIAEYGKDTRFGGGNNDPRAARAKSKPWSIRRAVNIIMNIELDFSEGATAPAVQLREFFGRKLTGAEVVALARVSEAMNPKSRSFAKMNQHVVEDVDGKLVERKIEANVSLADLVNGSHDAEDYSEEDDG